MLLLLQVFKWLDENCRMTKKTLDEKKVLGTYLRVFHWAEYKEIPPLSSLADIKTLLDTNGTAVTRIGHLWYEYKQPGFIKTREYACLTCSQCARLNFGSCALGFQRVGVLRTCPIKSAGTGGVMEERFTERRGIEMATKCKPGDLIGAECANKTEPYIISEVVKPLGCWSGPNGRSWMGQIKCNDQFLTCRKYQRRADSNYMQCEEENAVYYLLAGDVRIIFSKHKEIKPIERARRKSAAIANAPISYELDNDELELLNNRVYIPSRDH